MNRLFMLDTHTVSYIMKGNSVAARNRLAGLSDGDTACISTITETELLYGLAKSGSGKQRTQSLSVFLARMRTMIYGWEEAAAYGQLPARQDALGKPLGPFDTQIAAHALALGATIITNDGAF